MELQEKEINVKKMTILSILFPLFQGNKVNNPPPPLSLSLSLSLSLCMVSVRTPLLSTLSELTVTFNAKNIILWEVDIQKEN